MEYISKIWNKTKDLKINKKDKYTKVYKVILYYPIERFLNRQTKSIYQSIFVDKIQKSYTKIKGLKHKI